MDVDMEAVEIIQKGLERFHSTIPNKEDIVNEAPVESGKRETKTLPAYPKFSF